MAKKTPAPQKQPADRSQQLRTTLVTVKQLQAFLAGHGGLDGSLAAVAKVQDLVKLTGGFNELVEALKIVGEEAAPQA